MTARSAVPISVVTLLLAVSVQAQVLYVPDLNTTQFERLDRARTVVLLQSAILEEHGPFLPSYSDGYQVEYITDTLARAIAARPGWAVLVFPPIPLGSGPANVIGAKWSFPGSYPVRTATVRSIFMDLASAIGEQGFMWVFVTNAHAAPHHNRALDQAGDFFHDEYGGEMVNLGGIMSVYDAGCATVADRIPGEDGFSVHSGACETSAMIAIRPSLVSPARSSAAAVRGDSFPDLINLARSQEWPGYFGSPKVASLDLGQAIQSAVIAATVETALSILDGADPRTMPRYAEIMAGDPANSAVEKASLAHEREVEGRQRAWLERKRLP